MVNSQMDTQLDFFRGIEKWAPFRTSKDYDDNNPDLVDGSTFVAGLCRKLYGDSSASTELPATQVYRQFHSRPIHFVDEAKNASGRGPDYANMKAGTVNLKNFNGPLMTIEYTCKNGIFFHGPPNIQGYQSKNKNWHYPFTDKLINTVEWEPSNNEMFDSYFNSRTLRINNLHKLRYIHRKRKNCKMLKVFPLLAPPLLII